jgi:hypothetical protein
MMLRKKAIFFILMPAILLFPAGCAGRIDGALRRDGSAELSLEIAITPRMAAMLRSLSSLGSAARPAADRGASAGNMPRNEVPVISGPAIARSLAAAPGILSAELVNTGPAGITGSLSVSRVDKLFVPSGAPGQRSFVTLESGGGTAGNRLLVTLDRTTAPQLLAMISSDIRDYLSALFAPAATGEPLSKAEYLELVGDIYGKALADEIAAAEIAVTIGFPGTISSAKGGIFNGASARFAIALADILVLENPLEYEVVWK